MQYDYYTDLKVEALRLACSNDDTAVGIARTAAVYYDFLIRPQGNELSDPVCPACGEPCVYCVPVEDATPNDPKKEVYELYKDGIKIGEI